MKFAEAKLELIKPAKDGTATKEASLKSVWKQTGKKPKGLEIEPPPKEVDYLWQWFCELRNPSVDLSHQEIKAWADLNGLSLLPYELQTLKRLDTVYKSVLLNGG